jgi:hypothetical protein
LGTFGVYYQCGGKTDRCLKIGSQVQLGNQKENFPDESALIMLLIMESGWQGSCRAADLNGPKCFKH